MRILFSTLIAVLHLILFLQADNGKADDKQVTVKIKAVGDIMMGTIYPYPILPPDDGRDIFSNIQEHIKDCDILMANLEGTFDSTATIVKQTVNKDVFAFRMPLHYADYLKEAGFTVINIANNHAYDFGKPGLDISVSHLESKRIQYTGLKKQLTVIERNGLQIGIAGFYWKSYFNDITRLEESRRFIKSAKNSVDILIVTFHGGNEGLKALHTKDEMEFYGMNKRGNVVAFAHAAVESGADLIVGHGPHVPRALEFYKGKLIAYSLGNFLTYGVFNLEGARSRSFILEVEINGNGDYKEGKIIPVILKNQGIPFYDPDGEVIHILRDLSKEDFPETGAVINENFRILSQ